VRPGADEETIKAAYRKSAKELHPDLNASEKAHEYFVILKNAYEYLLEHPYSEEEVRQYIRDEKIRVARKKSYNEAYRRSSTAHYTLKEVLKQSRTARIIYVVFHVLFIFTGLWLVTHSTYDIFFHEISDHADVFSAYFAVIFGFFFGVVLTVMFLYSGITYIRNRLWKIQ
jgi:curved DNA-binding protein CbpA